MCFKNIQSTTLASYTFMFWKIPLLTMNTPLYNFQNMAYMHKRYAYQIFNYVAYKKKLTRVQPNLP
jgi:hypothetical protein